ncbi:uncharacterized protein LOC131993992 isoform X1 [Stomoxys calcitrans]|uniref:uncharacterized protein LOC131993992 isoform X1 n=2 Tax=Stomoxys calcitrans TaxID=35570 RepID=UPI0027E309CE|nr:uncharacterized protein LOC131993992 isoform X1 [Stomoxys calcitrans]XP_059221018.1 uncharacterized protein LOC131993992 isoform X1 [Stomoxys calcitrans]
MAYDDAKLISLIKANEVLYNRNHPLANTKHKKTIWQKLADEMGLSVERVNTRYRTLRDRFVRYKRSLITKGPDNNYDMAIMNRMEFLTPFIFIRSSGGKITWEGSEPNLCLSGEPIHSIDDSENESSAKYLLRERAKRRFNVDSSEDSSDTYMPNSKKTRRQAENLLQKTRMESTNAKRRDEQSFEDNADSNSNFDEDFYEAVQGFIQLCKSEERTQNKALQGFGQMIIATLSQMNTRKQSRAMSLVTEVVMEMKMEDDN